MPVPKDTSIVVGAPLTLGQGLHSEIHATEEHPTHSFFQEVACRGSPKQQCDRSVREGWEGGDPLSLAIQSSTDVFVRRSTVSLRVFLATVIDGVTSRTGQGIRAWESTPIAIHEEIGAQL